MTYGEDLIELKLDGSRRLAIL